MLQQLRIATFLLVTLTVLTGGIYPLMVTAIAQVVFPRQAQGSFRRVGDHVAGSELIGQSFTKPEYFWGRLSATSPVPYNAAASSGSNFGPMHPDLKRAAEIRIAALRAGGMPDQPIPVELVTASASGLDPHISPAAADFQVRRVAAARGIPEHLVRDLVLQHTQPRQIGFLGEPCVNVLLVNLALDGANPVPSQPQPNPEGLLELNSRRPLGE